MCDGIKRETLCQQMQPVLRCDQYNLLHTGLLMLCIVVFVVPVDVWRHDAASTHVRRPAVKTTAQRVGESSKKITHKMLRRPQKQVTLKAALLQWTQSQPKLPVTREVSWLPDADGDTLYAELLKHLLCADFMLLDDHSVFVQHQHVHRQPFRRHPQRVRWWKQ